jgi:hypothetical protein
MPDEKDNKKEIKWLRGARTFQYMKVSAGKRRGRAFDLKSQASDRLIMLFRKGIYGDRLARPMRGVSKSEAERLQEQAEFARLPAATRVRLLKRRRADLEEDLLRMEHSTSQIARTFHMPDILRKLGEINEEIRRLEEEAEEEI